jgi:hypothetical protein
MHQLTMQLISFYQSIEDDLVPDTITAPNRISTEETYEVPEPNRVPEMVTPDSIPDLE